MKFETWLKENKFYNREEFIKQNIEELDISEEAALKRWVSVEKQLRERYMAEIKASDTGEA